MMISVDQALSELFKLFSPVDTEDVPLSEAGMRILAHPVIASHNQPPFPSSAMDGYALNSIEADPEAQFQVIGTSAAGAAFNGAIKAGQAVRIFTGAPVPVGADKILIQEDCSRSGDIITLNKTIETASFIRPAGGDFETGSEINAPAVLDAATVSLCAAMGAGQVDVRRKPVFTLVATGDELAAPGEALKEDQIFSSNNYGLKAMLEAHGAEARILPIARDNIDALRTVLDLCPDADCIVTLGGASVGDHDLVGQLAQDGTLDTSFYKVAMRPGKPLLAGKYKNVPLVGLPGNPVSSLVCGQIFLRPILKALLGFKPTPRSRIKAKLSNALGPNGPREHYMRAQLNPDQTIKSFAKQDSSLLSVISKSNALLVRPPHQPALDEGDWVEAVIL